MKDVKVKIDYTPLLKAIKEQNLSETKIFKQFQEKHFIISVMNEESL